jgi:hypothetical protein
MDRYLNRRTTLIFDTQNNIKGYRYQLWCCARSVGGCWVAGWSRERAAGSCRCLPRLCSALVAVLALACLLACPHQYRCI